MYFDNVLTIDEAKNLFRDLCKNLHPDTSGYDSKADFIKMYSEFRNFKSSRSGVENENFDADKFYDMLKKFDELYDIKISFVGSFIWLEDLKKNATYLQREIIKKISIEDYNEVRFAPKKKCWYFSPKDYVQKSKPKKDLEEIKQTYGSKSFYSKEIKQIL
jgi:hypothetical protein